MFMPKLLRYFTTIAILIIGFEGSTAAEGAPHPLIAKVLQGLENPSDTVRAAAVENFGEKATEFPVRTVVPVAAKALGDPNADVRYHGLMVAVAAAMASPDLPGTAAQLRPLIPDLVRALDDPAGRVRGLAAETMVFVELPEGVEEKLLSMVRQDDQTVAIAAMNVLEAKGKGQVELDQIMGEWQRSSVDWKKDVATEALR